MVKGHRETDDPEHDARQEIKEEAGITDIVNIQPLDHEMTWTYMDDGEEMKAVCDCFLAEAPEDAFIDISQNPHDEHGTGHFLNYRDARDILTHDNQKRLLEHAREQLEEQ